MLPRSAIGTASLYSLSGSPRPALALFALAGLAALLLVVGYHTWLATAASWFLLVSLHQRNPLVNNGGDYLLALLLFWSLFLPLGACASIDSRFARSTAPRLIVSVGGFALLLQVVSVYVFGALLKSTTAWLTEASALYGSLSLDAIARPWTGVLLSFPRLLEQGSRAAYLLEMIGPFVAFVPVRTTWFRMAAVLAFVGFHTVLALTFELMLFPFVCMLAWVVFVPGPVWDRLHPLGPIRHVAAAWCGLVDRLASTVDRASRGAAWIRSPGVAGRASLAGSVMAAGFAAYVLAGNLSTVGVLPSFEGAFARTGRALYIGQHWAAVPTPPVEDGWWLAPAILHDGSQVDLYSQRRTVDWDRPASLSATYRSGRWRRYLLSGLWWRRDTAKIALFGDWLRRRWDQRHDPLQRTESMQVFVMVERTGPVGEPPRLSRHRVYEWAASSVPGSR